MKVIIEQKDKKKTVETIMKENQWSIAVVKPAVGSFANDVHKIQLGFINQKNERHLKQLSDQMDLLVQPFISSVKMKGTFPKFLFSSLFPNIFVPFLSLFFINIF